MKYTKRILGTFATLAVGGAFVASAHMGPEMDTNLSARFESEAKILGLSNDEVKNAWAAGKNIFDLAKEKGISTSTLKVKMDEARDLEIKTKMDALVTSGVITRAQADQRIVTMKKLNDVKGNRGKGAKRGAVSGDGERSTTSNLKSFFNL